MPEPIDFFYSDGVMTLTNGSAVVTGTFTSWEPGVLPYDIVFANDGQNGASVILSVESATSMTLAKPWAGPTLVDVPYFILRWIKHTDPRIYGVRVSDYLTRLKAIPENIEDLAGQIAGDRILVEAAAAAASASNSEAFSNAQWAQAERFAAEASALSASGSATTATTQAGIATTEADRAASYIPASVATSISGLTISNHGVTPNTHLNVGPGTGRDSTNTVNIVLASGIAKRIDANWAAGTNNGGLDTGTRANWLGYHVFVIRNPTTSVVDVLFSLSASSPVMPSGFTQKRRIGGFMLNGTAQITRARWYGGQVDLLPINPPLESYSAVDNSTLTLRDCYCPKGVKMKAKFHLFTQQPSATAGHIVVSDPDIGVPDAAGYAMVSKFLRTGASAGLQVEEWTNTNGQVYIVDSSGSGALFYMYATGWYDLRDEYA